MSGLARALAIGLLVFLVVAAPLAAAAQTTSTAAAKPAENILPSFEGRTLDGKPLSSASFTSRRLILFCFNPGVAQAAAYAAVIARLVPEQSRHNFVLAGVAMGLDSAKKRDFAKKHGLAFPIIDDDGDVAAALSLPAPVVLVGADAEGRVGLTMGGFEEDKGAPPQAVEANIRSFLRLPAKDALTDGKLELQPVAPKFEAKRMDGGETLRLADLAGKPVVLMFFQHQCSHCRDALRFFKAELPRYPETNRPVLVGVSSDSRSFVVMPALAAEKLDFFPVLEDPEHELSELYGSFAAVPDIVMIDREGRILFRSEGWIATHHPDLTRMRLAKLAGLDAPMLLSRIGFSGNDACAVCHPSQGATWKFTDHAAAFDTLVTRGEEKNAECVGCHVVGFGEKGGYSIATQEKHLENVGCEVCHGAGGGHLSSPGHDAPPTGDLQGICVKCHDQKHSLGFDYQTFLPKVSHAAILALRDSERARLVAYRDQPRDLLPSTAAFVGSAACQKCHEKEFATWSRSAHAHSVESLEEKGRHDEDACVRCHVTGYGKRGGFPDGEKAKHGEDLARVGCESCHGPGGDHVADGGRKPGTIVALADKCEGCVILKICGSCHDDANDPGFRFDVRKKIEAQRHGTPARP